MNGMGWTEWKDGMMECMEGSEKDEWNEGGEGARLRSRINGKAMIII